MISKIIEILKFKNLPRWARITLWICIPLAIIGIFTGLCVAFGFGPVVEVVSKIFGLLGVLI